jgi:hypothetical protein
MENRTVKNCWTTAELSEDTGTPQHVIVHHRGQGTLVPVQRRPSRLGGDLWGFETALALATARALRKLGVRLGDAVRVLDWLLDLKKEKLEKDFAAGRSWLRIDGERCRAELLTVEAALRFDFGGAAAAAVQPAALDVRAVVIALAARAKKRAEAKAEAKKVPAVVAG